MKKIIFVFFALLSTLQTWAFEEGKYYAIRRNGETGSYICASDASMNIAALDAKDGRFVWQFIPTGNADCYYIKNVGSETYIQTSNLTLSSLVALGTDPVEYMVSRGAGTTGSGTTYFLASTDQGEVNYNEDATLGLNKGANGVVAYYIKTGRGNSYWEIEEVDYSEEGPSQPAEPEVEDEDVCASIAAYRLPCGTYSAKTRLTQVDITGNGVLTELHYKPTAAGRYQLYTQERAVLMPAGEVILTAALVGADEPGLVVTVWADFDGNGTFETSVRPTLGEQIEARFTVPAGTSKQGRFRIRVDQSGAETPNADFYGTLYDLPFGIGEVQTQRTLSVSCNQDSRGSVSIQGTDQTVAHYDLGAEVTVAAVVKDGFYFHGWRQGRTLVSYKPEYTVKMTENKNLVAVFATTEGEVVEEDDGTYPVNFPKNATATRTDRKLNAISLTAADAEKQTLSVGGNKVYTNLTRNEANYFQCKAGDPLLVEFGYTGSWMHGYVFIDEDGDKQFSYKEGETDQRGTEVKSFSFYSGSFTDSNQGYNSAGESIAGSARNTLDCPQFLAPSVPGDYRIRFKVDWNSVDPGGQLAADGTATGSNGIIANGGAIADAILRVGDATGIESIEQQKKHDIYTLDGRKVQHNTLNVLDRGVYIVSGKKVYVK